MADFKAVFFLVFASLVLLGAYVFAKSQQDLLVGIVLMVSGIILLKLFSKVVVK